MRDNDISISVTIGNTSSGDPIVKEYGVVFNTTTMGCLERMDISGLNLDTDVLTRIRALSYYRATKVAIKFYKPWWIPLGITKGGVSSSDLPISNVVYPSWNNDPDTRTVLMVSYCWAQDATRMGSLILDYNLVNLKSPILLCLSVHRTSPNSGPASLAPLVSTSSRKCTSPITGSPGPKINIPRVPSPSSAPASSNTCIQPFSGRNVARQLWMCGEATNAHHAWILGALDSAYIAVVGWLIKIDLSLSQGQLKASLVDAGPESIRRKWTKRLRIGTSCL